MYLYMGDGFDLQQFTEFGAVTVSRRLKILVFSAI